MRYVKAFLPFLTWLPEYRADYLGKDIMSGVTVGVMLIPQGMAYALIAGLPPVYGLYASIVPMLMYVFMGTSRHLSVAPVAMDSLLVAAGVSALAQEGTASYIEYVLLLALMIGAIQLLLGLFKLGFITNLLAKPVISGFTSAAAVIIALNQVKHLIGIEVKNSDKLFKLMPDLVGQADQLHWVTFVVGLGGIILIKLLTRLNKNIPGALLAIALGVLLTFLMKLQDQGLVIVGQIPVGMPSFKLPEVPNDALYELFPLAVTIAMVGFVESFSVAKAIESKAKDYKVSPNKELVALGFSNLAGSFFQAFPVAGSFSRSAINYDSGAKTPIASLISMVLVIITLLFLTPVFYYLPKTILGAVIMVSVYKLIELRYARDLWKESKAEFSILVITFIVTVTFGMVPGIIAGVTISILFLLYKAAYPHVAFLGKVEGYEGFRNVARFKGLKTWENIIILRVDAPITFINIQYFKEFVQQAIDRSSTSAEFVILDAGPVSYLDATAASGMKELIRVLNSLNIDFLICDMIGPVRDSFYKNGLLEVVGESHIFIDLNEAVRFATTKNEGRFKRYALQSGVNR